MNKRITSIIIVFLLTITIINFKVETPASAATATPVGISLTKTVNKIPTASEQGQDLVNKGQVIYRVTIKANVITTNGYAAANVPIKFSDPDTSTVKLSSSSSTKTNSSGTAYAYYEVRGTTSFTCKASTNSSSYSGSTSEKITPSNPASYVTSFYITCYNTPKESDFTGSKVSVSGISGYTFKSDFIAAVKLNGSGYSSNGFYIKYNGSNTYAKGNPKTSTGTTPTAGKTIAVDNYYIPRYNNNGTYLRGTVKLSNIGYRSAEDSGDMIDKYHIDVYVGTGKAAVNNFKYQDSYQSAIYYGNNVDKW